MHSCLMNCSQWRSWESIPISKWVPCLRKSFVSLSFDQIKLFSKQCLHTIIEVVRQTNEHLIRNGEKERNSNFFATDCSQIQNIFVNRKKSVNIATLYKCHLSKIRVHLIFAHLICINILSIGYKFYHSIIYWHTSSPSRSIQCEMLVNWLTSIHTKTLASMTFPANIHKYLWSANMRERERVAVHFMKWTIQDSAKLAVPIPISTISCICLEGWKIYTKNKSIKIWLDAWFSNVFIS